MLVRNVDPSLGLVNGARGVVTGFDAIRRNYPKIRFLSGIEKTIEPVKWEIEVEGVIVASRKQVPLRLAWAMTIHKCQGCSLDRAEISLRGIFESGQAYVALSRVKTLKGLKLIGFNSTVVKVNDRVLSWWRNKMRDNLVDESGIVPVKKRKRENEQGSGHKEKSCRISLPDKVPTRYKAWFQIGTRFKQTEVGTSYKKAFE